MNEFRCIKQFEGSKIHPWLPKNIQIEFRSSKRLLTLNGYVKLKASVKYHFYTISPGASAPGTNGCPVRQQHVAPLQCWRIKQLRNHHYFYLFLPLFRKLWKSVACLFYINWYCNYIFIMRTIKYAHTKKANGYIYVRIYMNYDII